MRTLPVRACVLTRGDRVLLRDRTLARVEEVAIVRRGVKVTVTTEGGDGTLEIDLLEHGEELDVVSPVGMPGGCRACSGDGVHVVPDSGVQMPCGRCHGSGVLLEDPDPDPVVRGVVLEPA